MPLKIDDPKYMSRNDISVIAQTSEVTFLTYSTKILTKTSKTNYNQNNQSDCRKINKIKQKKIYYLLFANCFLNILNIF